jgi:hypothetical protein
MLDRSNPLPITRRHHGSKDQVHDGSMATMTITSSRSMRRSPTTSLGDTCPSLHEASMITRQVSMVHSWAIIIHLPWAMSSLWTSLVSTLGPPQLKRANKTSTTLYTNRPTGRSTQHRPSLTFVSTSSKNRIIRIGCLVPSTMTIRCLISDYHDNS